MRNVSQTKSIRKFLNTDNSIFLFIYFKYFIMLIKNMEKKYNVYTERKLYF